MALPRRVGPRQEHTIGAVSLWISEGRIVRIDIVTGCAALDPLDIVVLN
jgi:hypothetical protein